MRTSGATTTAAPPTVPQTPAGTVASIVTPSATGSAAVTSLMAGIRRLNQQLGIPELIVDAGVAQDEFRAAIDQMASSALEDGCTPSNPVHPTREDLVLLLRKLG